MFFGRVLDNSNGNPLCGIPVSDGRNISFTDAEGHFELAGWERAHVINVCALTRNHYDWYCVADSSEREIVFRIDLEPDCGEDFNFMHISDTEIEGCGGVDWVGFAKACVTQNKPAFLAHTGDLCRYNGVHRHYFALNRETVGCPVRYAIGNHDFIMLGYHFI